MPAIGYKHTDESLRKIGETHRGKTVSEETRRKLSNALKGNKNHLGKKHTNETRRILSEQKKGSKHSMESKQRMSDIHKGHEVSEETRRKLSDANSGSKLSDAHRQKLSAAKQGIPYDEWESYATEQLYCPKFNEACREANRAKYGNECFVCGKSGKDNGQKLSVHHIDMNKMQGCTSGWKLIPLCRLCHSKAHNGVFASRLEYIIEQR